MLAALVVALMKMVGWGMRFRGIEAAEARLRVIRERWHGNNVVFYHWSEDELSRLVFAARGAGWELGADIAYVCDDTWGGRLGAAILERLGHRAIPFRSSHGALRVQDMRALIREPGPVSISADGRGPYGRVNASLPRLVQRRAAIAVPVSVRASNSVRFRRPGLLAIPAPGACLAIAVGSPIVRGQEGPVSAEALEMGLREASESASRLLMASR